MVARAGSWRVVEVDGYLPPRPPPAGTSTPVGYKYFSPAGPVHTWRSSRPGPAAIKQQQGHCHKRQQRSLAIWVFGPCHFSVVGPVAAGLVGHGTEPGCACTCAPRTIACWAAGATEPLPARIFAFSASNSACVSTPESSSSFKPFSFATVSDICGIEIKKSEVTKQPVVLEDDGGQRCCRTANAAPTLHEITQIRLSPSVCVVIAPGNERLRKTRLAAPHSPRRTPTGSLRDLVRRGVPSVLQVPLAFNATIFSIWLGTQGKP